MAWLVVAIVLAWAGWRFAGGYPPPPIPLQALSAREYATVAAAADATFPPGGDIPPSGTEAEVPRHVDRFVGAQQPSTRLLMRMLFVLVEHATIAFPAGGPGGRRRFSALSPEQRVAVLDGWRTSALYPRRLVFQSLRAIVGMGYFADVEVMRHLGLLPRRIERRVCEADLLWGRIGEPAASSPFTAADLGRAPGEPLGPHGEVDLALARGGPGGRP